MACHHIAGVRCSECWDIGRPAFGYVSCPNCATLAAKLEQAERELTEVMQASAKQFHEIARLTRELDEAKKVEVAIAAAIRARGEK